VPLRRLNNVDLPTLGRPISATTGSRAYFSRSATSSPPSVST